MNIKQILINILPAWCLQTLINTKNTGRKHSSAIQNIGRHCIPQKRVLISYVNDYLYIKDWTNQTSTRNVECAEIVDAFLRKDCCVDICRHDDISITNKQYDIIFGFGEAYRKSIKNNPTATKILYLTEKPPYYSAKKEQERIENLYQRHGIKVPVSRSGLFYCDEDMANYDACVIIGQEKDVRLLKKQPTFAIYPTGLINKEFQLTTEITDKQKSSFLWLGSRGAVHKGLDLLFDVFAKHPDFTLHVAGLNAIDKKRLLKIMPSNVVDHGFVNIRSKHFSDLANSCSFIISASCSEGVSTALLTGMNHGLIPLRSDECSIPFESVGEVFEDNTIDCIEQVVMKWASMQSEVLIHHRQEVMEFARQNFNINQFSNNIHDIIGTIIGD